VVGLDWLFGPQKFRAHVLQHGVMAGGVVMGCAHSELVPAYVAIILGSLIAAPCTWVGLRYPPTSHQTFSWVREPTRHDTRHTTGMRRRS
jgi:hypothetical protein